MRYELKKGTHRAKPFRFAIWWSIYRLAYRVLFHTSCEYNIGEDQEDVNKLFGIGYIPHKKESIRFGWNYNPTTERIRIYAYWYDNGVRDFKYMCEVLRNIQYDLSIEVHSDYYRLAVNRTDQPGYLAVQNVPKHHSKKLSYRLGTYFGGDKVCPSDMVIHLSRI